MNESDTEILRTIRELVAEEHGLRDRVQAGELGTAEERARLGDLEAALDQCWDLLRQRRARSEYGEDPSGARVRPVSEVEEYEQ